MGRALGVFTDFMYGVLLGVAWECASIVVLLTATLVERMSGTLLMAITFLGFAAFGFIVAARADLGRLLLSIFAFRLTAQLVMTVGTGSVHGLGCVEEGEGVRGHELLGAEHSTASA